MDMAQNFAKFFRDHMLALREDCIDFDLSQTMRCNAIISGGIRGVIA